MAVLLSPRPFLWLAPLAGTLARAPVSGGSPREVAENVTFADWSPDGAQLAIVRAVPGGQVLEFPIGKSLYETPGQIVMPKISPKGDMVAFIPRQAEWNHGRQRRRRGHGGGMAGGVHATPRICNLGNAVRRFYFERIASAV
jgi:dipeptidyl aminopeptidase/acylaminoacyl peptidase